MKTRSETLCLAAIACALALGGCNNSAFLPPDYLGVTLAPRPASIAAGTTMVFTATVSNNLSVPQWSLLDASLTASAGTLAPVAGSSNSILYTAPATPPIYNNVPTTGFVQGVVTLDVNVTAPPGTSYPVTGDSISFVITAPSITVNLTPATANVALNTSLKLYGYALGNVNNSLTWQIDGFTAGAVPVPLSSPVTYTYPYGTIDATGLFTAPASLPASGDTVTVTAVSQVDPTRSASSVVTLQ